MTTQLELWLTQATGHLSRESAAQVRNEIAAHYDGASEIAMQNGASSEEADRLALTALGDAKTANRQYRKVLLTSGEARVLREGDWEAKAICSRKGLKWVLMAIPMGALLAGIGYSFANANGVAQVLLAGGLGMSLLFAAMVLPVYTPRRSRVFRAMKWLVMVGIMVLAFWPMTLQWSWLLFSCLWPVAWVEWTRMSIRRKLPVTKWPKQLYL